MKRALRQKKPQKVFAIVTIWKQGIKILSLQGNITFKTTTI